MKLDKTLLKYLEKTIKYLENSNDCIYSNETVSELIDRMKLLIKNNDINELKIIFSPTNSLQDIAIDNGWGDEYCNIAKSIDRFIK